MLCCRKDTIIRSSNKPLEDIDICSQAYTFLLAGYESSSLALTYTLYEVSKKPDLQKRLQQEVDGVLSAKKDGKLEFSDIASLQLCEATFSEALRMWPPGSSIVALVRMCLRVFLQRYHCTDESKMFVFRLEKLGKTRQLVGTPSSRGTESCLISTRYIMIPNTFQNLKSSGRSGLWPVLRRQKDGIRMLTSLLGLALER